MRKNSFLKQSDKIVRVLEVKDSSILTIDCIKRTMPEWKEKKLFVDWMPVTEQELWESTGIYPTKVDTALSTTSKYIQEHYALIAGILPFIGDEKERSRMIRSIAEHKHYSKQTIRNTLCLYLAFQDISVLAPKQKKEKELTSDEKIMRWALNKFFYTKHQNTITTAYTMMLKEKYTDAEGNLLPHPSIYQFRYFYKKTKNLQNFYISRDGIKKYQRNKRPLLGEGVQEFASNVGVGMLDSTICDIYLVNDRGELIGRPVLTACIDAYSSLCCGYSLGWEGGTYSLRGLMLNVVTDKVAHCRKHGIDITEKEWDCKELPGTLVTDKGSEYASENFEQLTDMGVSIINLPSYRPELKGSVEKFFDLVQSTYKPSGMSTEIYSKLYLAILRSLQKKGTKLAIQQLNSNKKNISKATDSRNKQAYSGIIGGSDSFTIIGTSGIGKSSAISRALHLITASSVIERGMLKALLTVMK